MWTFQTHYPYFTTGPLKDYNTGNGTLERYLNALNRADETLKALVKGLQDRGLLESTLIVVCGDHGEAFGRHNQSTHASAVYEENLHVPLILMNPQLFQGERLPVIGGISDIAPTIFSVLNKPAPPTWQGENLFSISRRERVYFFNPYVEYLFGLRDGNLKLIYNITADKYEVYDMEKDPKETTDVSKENETFVKQAKEKLHAWMYYQDEYMKKISEYKIPNTTK
jgi:lipoteichoic acid synthase